MVSDAQYLETELQKENKSFLSHVEVVVVCLLSLRLPHLLFFPGILPDYVPKHPLQLYVAMVLS